MRYFILIYLNIYRPFIAIVRAFVFILFKQFWLLIIQMNRYFLYSLVIYSDYRKKGTTPLVYFIVNKI